MVMMRGVEEDDEDDDNDDEEKYDIKTDDFLLWKWWRCKNETFDNKLDYIKGNYNEGDYYSN